MQPGAERLREIDRIRQITPTPHIGEHQARAALQSAARPKQTSDSHTVSLQWEFIKEISGEFPPQIHPGHLGNRAHHLATRQTTRPPTSGEEHQYAPPDRMRSPAQRAYRAHRPALRPTPVPTPTPSG